jgi:hypothetical protein
MIVRNSEVDQFLLGPAADFKKRTLIHVAGQFPVLSLRNKPETESGNGGRSRIPRPPNAWIIYRKEHHSIVLAQNPGIRNNDICKCYSRHPIFIAKHPAAVIIGQMWQNESWEVHAKYRAMADKAKKEHLLKHPGYTYKPRKSSEKKRRMSKKKLAAMSASFNNAYAFSQVAQETGGLTGEIDERRFTTLPLSATSAREISEHNALFSNSSVGLAAQPVAEGFTPNAEYAAAQQADEYAINMAMDPAAVNSIMGDEVSFGGLYSTFTDPYEMSQANYPEQWTY